MTFKSLEAVSQCFGVYHDQYGGFRRFQWFWGYFYHFVGFKRSQVSTVLEVVKILFIYLFIFEKRF